MKSIKCIYILIFAVCCFPLHAEEDIILPIEEIVVWEPNLEFSYPTNTLKDSINLRGEIQSKEVVHQVDVHIHSGFTGGIARTYNADLYYKANNAENVQSIAFSTSIQIKPQESWVEIKATLESGRKLVKEFAIPTSPKNDDYYGLGGLAEKKIHQDAVSSLYFARNNKFLVSASDDGTIKVSNPRTLKEILKIKAQQGYVKSAIVTNDCQHIVSGGEDGSVKIWEVATGKLVHTFKGHESMVKSIALSNNGKYAASGGENMPVILWDLESKTKIKEISNHLDVNKIIFTQDSRYILAATEKKEIIMWNAETGNEKYVREDTHLDRTLSIAMHPNMRTLFSGGREGDIKWWRALLNPYDTDENWEGQTPLWEMRLFLIKEKDKDISLIDPATLSSAIRRYSFYYMKKKPSGWFPFYESKTVHPFNTYGTPIIHLDLTSTGEYFLFVSRKGHIRIYNTVTASRRVKQFVNETLWSGALAYDGGLIGAADVNGKVYTFGFAE